MREAQRKATESDPAQESSAAQVSILETALRTGDYQKAAQAQDRLRALGVEVRFTGAQERRLREARRPGA